MEEHAKSFQGLCTSMIDEEIENIEKQKLNGQGEQNDQQVSVQVKIIHVCKLYIHQILNISSHVYAT